MATVQVTQDNFESTLKNNELVILDFWASWCGPCKTFGPIFEQASEANSDVVFGKINTEEEQEIASTLGIRSIPTTMIFRDNVLLFSQPGVLPAKSLDQVLQQARELDMDQVRAEMEARRAEQ
ncbi:MAG: thioredoxin [Reinekea sp.]|jgi:thioredoxin 1